MFEHNKTFSSFPVDDAEAAILFYRDVLKLPVREFEYGFEIGTSGAGNIFVYAKADHQPATFTILNFQVADIAAAVKALKVKEVAFESYNLPDIKTDENDICHMPEMQMKQAWFKDSAGNILSLIEESK